MQRPSPWLMLVVLLVGIVLLREPRFAYVEERFLCWLIRQSQTKAPAVPLTVIEIGADPLIAPSAAPPVTGGNSPGTGSGNAISPLEFALFLQALLDFEPGVVAFENILKWRERDKDQEQVFLDQAMRVPKLLLASELGANADPDAPWAEIKAFSQVTGKRGELATFSGVTRQPNEDLRLISTAGFVNLPDEVSSEIRVPLLFLYRGEVIPSFALQAVLLWLRVTPAEAKVVLGSHIELPQGRRIPIGADGTLVVDPNLSKRAQRLSLNELLLAAQEREKGSSAEPPPEVKDHIVLVRTPANPLSPPDLFAATIATLQGNSYLRRVTPLFDFGLLLLIAAAAGFIRKMDRMDLLLSGVAVTAAYGLVALGTVSRWNIWLPGVLPLGAVWSAVLVAVFFRTKGDTRREKTTDTPPAA